MKTENTCNAITVSFINDSEIYGYSLLGDLNFFPYSKECDTKTGFLFFDNSQGFIKCDNPPFSDFAV